MEHTTKMIQLIGAYGKTLTVLYGIDIPDEDENEDNLVESYTPRFRR